MIPAVVRVPAYRRFIASAAATASVVALYRPLLGLDVSPVGEPLVSGLIISQPPVEVNT